MLDGLSLTNQTQQSKVYMAVEDQQNIEMNEPLFGVVAQRLSLTSSLLPAQTRAVRIMTTQPQSRNKKLLFSMQNYTSNHNQQAQKRDVKESPHINQNYMKSETNLNFKKLAANSATAKSIERRAVFSKQINLNREQLLFDEMHKPLST